MNTTDQSIKLKELLDSKGWEIYEQEVRKMMCRLGTKICFGDLMDVKDENLTQSDLKRESLRVMRWLVEELPNQMVENPNYVPEIEDAEDLTYEEHQEIVEEMFKQHE